MPKGIRVKVFSIFGGLVSAKVEVFFRVVSLGHIIGLLTNSKSYSGVVIVAGLVQRARKNVTTLLAQFIKMRLTRFGLAILFILILSTSWSQKRTVGAIGFYNVENLFDTQDNPEKRDEEYTPNGDRGWDQDRYTEKQKNIAEVLSKMANGADIIGLAEVENLFVLAELVARPELKKFNYQIIHQESPDRRGIDCALIYKPSRFKVLNYKTLKFPKEGYDTRDVLHVTGEYFGDTLHVFVNHWPSRFGGQADMRQLAAERVRGEVDDLLKMNKQAKIVIMGDFNDDPINKSIKKVLGASDKYKKLDEGELYNPSADVFKQGVGTLFYRGAWNLFDQIIVSQGMLTDAEGISYQQGTFSIFGPDWMRQKSGAYAGAPNRSFGGGAYLGGYSDHFPTYILIEK